MDLPLCYFVYTIFNVSINYLCRYVTYAAMSRYRNQRLIIAQALLQANKYWKTSKYIQQPTSLL